MEPGLSAHDESKNARESRPVDQICEAVAAIGRSASS